jgi:hypothetical protein
VELISKSYLSFNRIISWFYFSNIKIFSPLAETPVDDSELINRTVKRNHAMTEETSSTITVPAAFMFRMLTSFYRLRRPEGLFGLDDDDDEPVE